MEPQIPRLRSGQVHTDKHRWKKEKAGAGDFYMTFVRALVILAISSALLEESCNPCT